MRNHPRQHLVYGFGITILTSMSLSAGCMLNFDDAVPCDSNDDCVAEQVCDAVQGRCKLPSGDVDVADTGGDEDSTITRPTDAGDDTGTTTAPPDTGTPDVPPDTAADDTGAGETDTTPQEDACVPTGVEVCDEVDNDCNGEVDEGDVCGGTGECPDDMASIDDSGVVFCIDVYEASRTDATGESVGTADTMGPSRANVLPWDNIGFDAAVAQCEAAGKRLCTQEEWVRACGGAERRAFPYSMTTYDALACNTGSSDSAPSATGTFPDCQSPERLFDMSGNVAEWTTIRTTRGGSYSESVDFNLRCSRPSGQAADLTAPGNQVGFRCCADL